MDTKLYAIRAGFSLRTDAGEIFLAGGVIELTEGQAKPHLHKLEQLDADKQKEFFAEREASAAEQVRIDQEADARRKASEQENVDALAAQLRQAKADLKA